MMKVLLIYQVAYVSLDFSLACVSVVYIPLIYVFPIMSRRGVLNWRRFPAGPLCGA